MTEHEKNRANKTWSSQDGSRRRVKDLSDSHLLHIIGNILSNNGRKIDALLTTMMIEAEYRHENRIYVPEYEDFSKLASCQQELEREKLRSARLMEELRKLRIPETQKGDTQSPSCVVKQQKPATDPFHIGSVTGTIK